MADSQIISKQRVTDHGEVYTHEREVNAMLDLVKDQTERIDARFLEPACGTGNFLVEILRRKLQQVDNKHRKIQLDYERNAITAISSIYGIELLPDNVVKCRERLLDIFAEHYKSLFPHTYKQQCLNSAQYILSQNILCGDALSLLDNQGNPIVFPEWSFAFGNMIKRRDYVYRTLIYKDHEDELPLLPSANKNAVIPTPIKEYPLVHFLEVGDE